MNGIKEAKERLYSNPHYAVHMDIEHMSDDDLKEVIEAQEKNRPKVDFRLLCELLDEADPCMGFTDLISKLSMDDVPMTDAVRKLGICAGILYA